MVSYIGHLSPQVRKNLISAGPEIEQLFFWLKTTFCEFMLFSSFGDFQRPNSRFIDLGYRPSADLGAWTSRRPKCCHLELNIFSSGPIFRDPAQLGPVCTAYAPPVLTLEAPTPSHFQIASSTHGRFASRVAACPLRRPIWLFSDLFCKELLLRCQLYLFRLLGCIDLAFVDWYTQFCSKLPYMANSELSVSDSTSCSPESLLFFANFHIL